MSEKRSVFFSGFVTLVLVFTIISYDRGIVTVRAAINSNNVVSGWAWSDTTEWISFSCLSDPAGCTGHSYSVEFAKSSNTDRTVSGNLSGYAWSDRIGWINFQCGTNSECFGPGDNNLFPTGGGLQARAQVVDNKLQGWARACAVFKNDCKGQFVGTVNATDPVSSSVTLGGWDGWISMSGGSGSTAYGVTFDPATNKFGTFSNNNTKYAWGDVNLGWISFQPRSPSDCTDKDPSLCGVVFGAPALSVYCTVEKDTNDPNKATWKAYPIGGSTGDYTYTWTPSSNATICNGFQTGSNQPSTFITTCTNTTDNTITVNATVTVTSEGDTITSNSCSAVAPETGVGLLVTNPQPGYSINAAPSSLRMDFADTSANKATTTPPSKITLQQIIPSRQYSNNVTLSAANPVIESSNVTGNGGLNNANVVLQFSKDISNPTSWSNQITLEPDATAGTANREFSEGVSLQIHFKTHPPKGTYTIRIQGNGTDGSKRPKDLTVVVDGGKSGIIER